MLSSEQFRGVTLTCSLQATCKPDPRLLSALAPSVFDVLFVLLKVNGQVSVLQHTTAFPDCSGTKRSCDDFLCTLYIYARESEIIVIA